METNNLSSSGVVSRLITLFILLASLLVLPKAHAAVDSTFTVDHLEYKVLTEDKASKTGTVSARPASAGISGDIMIPASVANGGINYSVTFIPTYAFYEHNKLTSIVIPDSVTSIDVLAFWDCSSLIEIIVGKNNPNYSSLDGVLFNKDQTILTHCPSGISAAYTVPNSVTSIGYGAFSCCRKLTSIIIPDSATSIGYGAFYNCDSLTSIIIPDSVTSIEDGAFYNCKSLTSIIIPDSVTSIGNYAFYDCTGLKSLYFKGDAPSMGSDAFFNCSAMETIYYIKGTTGWTNPWQKIATATWTPEPEPTVPELAYAVKGGKFVLTFSGGSLQASSDLILWSPVEGAQGGKYEVNLPKTGKTFYRVAK